MIHKEDAMLKLRILLPALLILMLAVGSAWAQPQEQEPFNATELNKFLGDYPDFIKWTENHHEEWKQLESTPMKAGMKVSQDVLGFAREKGWDPPQRFFYVMGQVSAGIAQIKMPQMASDMSGMLKQQRKMIADNPNIPAAQKKEALADIDKALAEAAKQGPMEGPTVHPEEMALIRANQQEIEKVMGMAPGS